MDTRLNRLVAIKLPRNGYSNDPGFGSRPRNEAMAVAQLLSPNIIGVYDYDQEGDRAFIAMEFVSGPDLKKYLSVSGPLSEEKVLETGEPLDRIGKSWADLSSHRVPHLATGRALPATTTGYVE